MTMSNSGAVMAFVKGSRGGGSENVWAEGDILYSYGLHFPLLVRCDWGMLMNADRYSVTTSQHQGRCFEHATIQVAFSALNRVITRGIHGAQEYLKVELVDKERERWDIVGYQLFDPITKKHNRISKGEHDAIAISGPPEKRACLHDIQERRPEAALLRYEDKLMLSSMDGANYFLSVLPDRVETVAEARACLVPEWARGKEGVKRQGEWFFVPATTELTRSGVKALTEKDVYLRAKSGTIHHKVRDYMKTSWRPGPLVRGTVRHDERDHPMLKLGEIWHVALESRHIVSYSAKGGVD